MHHAKLHSYTCKHGVPQNRSQATRATRVRVRVEYSQCRVSRKRQLIGDCGVRKDCSSTAEVDMALGTGYQLYCSLISVRSPNSLLIIPRSSIVKIARRTGKTSTMAGKVTQRVYMVDYKTADVGVSTHYNGTCLQAARIKVNLLCRQKTPKAGTVLFSHPQPAKGGYGWPRAVSAVCISFTPWCFVM